MSQAVARIPLTLSIPESDYVSLPVAALARGERRLDGEAYLTGGFGIRTQLQADFECKDLSVLAHVWQPNRLKGIQVSPEHGTPFLTATQVFDLRPRPRKFLASSRTPYLKSRFVEPGWILVTCSGSVGDVICSYAPHFDRVISHDLLRVAPFDQSLTGFLYTFLRTRFGRTMMRSTRYGSVVKHLEPEHLFDLPVPRIPTVLQEALANEIETVFAMRSEAYKLTLLAEHQYAECYEDPTQGVSSEGQFVVKVLAVRSGRRRLDAYHYNPSAAVALATIRRGAFRMDPLPDVTAGVFGVPRFKHVYAHKGIPYVDSEDLFKINPELNKLIPEVTKADAQRYFVQPLWLLMASSGQLYGLNGSVVLATGRDRGRIVSNHVLRIVPGTGIRPGYLVMALGHPSLGRPLVLTLAFGSEVPEIAAEDLKTLEIPRLSQESEQLIADAVERAAALRATADAQEDAAVAMLEAFFESRISGHPEEHALRVAQYRGAYAKQPTTEFESAWATSAALNLGSTMDRRDG